MRLRTKARHLALKVLYQMFLVGCTADQALEGVVSAEGPSEERLVTFARQLVDGVSSDVERLDVLLRPCVTANWNFDRLGLLERCILRMATFEIVDLEDVPCRVTLDEAVALAKDYVGLDAGRLVNGVLHRLAQEHDPEGLVDGCVTP